MMNLTKFLTTTQFYFNCWHVALSAYVNQSHSISIPFLMHIPYIQIRYSRDYYRKTYRRFNQQSKSEQRTLAVSLQLTASQLSRHLLSPAVSLALTYPLTVSGHKLLRIIRTNENKPSRHVRTCNPICDTVPRHATSPTPPRLAMNGTCHPVQHVADIRATNRIIR